MEKQTAIDWLYEVLQDYDIDTTSENSTILINKLNLKYLIEQAKIVERMQIQNSFYDGQFYAKNNISKFSSEYYNETYKK
jgi:hypothetical protein